MKVILVLIAVGLFANAFAPVVEIREAQAQVDCATSSDLQLAEQGISSDIQLATNQIISAIQLLSH